jgi:hypothetical protein
MKPSLEQLEQLQTAPAGLDIYAGAAAFYVQLVKSGYGDEASEFAEWFLEAFDLDLES